MDIDEVLLETEDRMDKSVQVLRENFAKVRTGKASIGLFDGIKVNLYGTEMALNQCSNLMAPEARLIIIQPYDKNSIPAIEKAILTSDLGLNPVNDGTVVRIAIPTLTEERRKDLVKIIHRYAEESKTAIRQIRRDANDQIKKGKDDGGIPEDQMYRTLDDIQKMTDEHVKTVDQVKDDKEAEIMEV